MSVDLPTKTDKELALLIANHERRHSMGATLMLEAVAEQSRRKDGGLDLDRTLELILAAAREDRFVTEKEIAAQSGQGWAKVKTKVANHVRALSIIEHARSGTMPGVAVVPDANRQDGALPAEALAAFETLCVGLNRKEKLRGAPLLEQERGKLAALAREKAA
jgi:esterase/lipase superfamily enzyme